MFLSETQQKTKELLNSLRQRVELLDSHKTMKLISRKQYEESMQAILDEVQKLEWQFGLIEEPTEDHFLLKTDEDIKAIEESMEEIETILKIYNAREEEEKIFND